jgi:hypothetical protein
MRRLGLDGPAVFFSGLAIARRASVPGSRKCTSVRSVSLDSTRARFKYVQVRHGGLYGTTGSESRDDC